MPENTVYEDHIPLGHNEGEATQVSWGDENIWCLHEHKRTFNLCVSEDLTPGMRL